MYDYIKGEVAELTPACAVIEAGGVGFLLNVSLQTFSALHDKKEAKLYVHYYVVRDDAPVLYGFATKAERDLFRMLVSVSGVGGNTARMILSGYSPAELSSIISGGRSEQLKSVKGIGLKTAQRIIVELKDKMGGVGSDGGAVSLGATPHSAVLEEALAALTMLGFGKAPAEKALRQIMEADASISVEMLIKTALKKL